MRTLSRKAFLQLSLAAGAARMLPLGIPDAAAHSPRKGPDMRASDRALGVQGQVLRPGDEGYDAERAGWNTIVQHRPAVIVVAVGADDVAAAVRYAAAEGLPVAVQATGHGPSVPADGAVLVSTRRMTDLEIDPATATARISAGVLGRQLIDAAMPHGLAPLVGTSTEIGMVGYLTSGGLPVLGRAYGFAADHVRAIEVVTADGQVRRATADEHPDLFWAVRGGKGNFGIVTTIETGLVPQPRLYGGGLLFPGAAAREIVRSWVAWTAGQPDEMSSSLAPRRFPDLPAVPEPMRGELLIHVRIAYTGSAEEGEHLVQPLRALGPLIDSIAETPYDRIGEINNNPTEPAPARERGTLLRALDEEAIERLVALAGPDVDLPPGLVESHHLGGALGRAPAIPNAVGNRDAAFSLHPVMIAPPGQVEQVDRLQQALSDGLTSWDTGATLANFLSSADSHPDRVRAAYRASDYQRLAAIKATYDPRNLFRVNHNIPPA